VSSGCSDDPARAPRRLLVPWFALTFVSVVALNSLLRTPAPLVTAINSLDTFLLAMAMAALGLTTQLSALRKAGGGPILLGLLLWGWLILGGALINSLVFAAFT
jgi:uncharacterized integral membrane protein (TIGR00698 family)